MSDLKESFSIEKLDISKNVSDFAQIIEKGREKKIDKLINSIESRTSMEIAVVTINSLEGEQIENIAYKLFNKFGLGKRDKNNGILFLISRDDNQYRIEIGLGLEEIIDDDLKRELLNKIISLEFKKKNFGKAILRFLRIISERISRSGFSLLAKISNITGIIAVSVCMLELVLSIFAVFNGYFENGNLLPLDFFAVAASPVIILALIAVICGIIDISIVKAKDIETRRLSKSITGTVLGFLTVVIVLAVFLYFPQLINFLAGIFSMSTGSY